MSPNTPNDFIGSLVEMAEAYRELPKVQEALKIANDACAIYAKHVSDREESILKLKAEAEALNSRIRSLEVERDDAQFHALEADDRTQRALDFIKATFGNAGTLIQALEPPRATPAQSVDAPSAVTMPVNEPEPTIAPSTEKSAEIMADYGRRHAEPEGLHTTQPQGQSEPFPSSPEQSSASAPVESGIGIEPSPAPEVAPAHPTANATEDASTHPSASSSTDAATKTEPSSTQPRQPGKYEGLTYSAAHQHYGLDFKWPSKDEWLSDGGTLDNFYA